MGDAPKRIAVVGGGVAGITAAHILQRAHDVTLFERNDYVGGHTNTLEIPDGPDAGTPVDTGFIVCNDWTYPTFLRLLDQLGVAADDSDMSFSFHCRRTGFQYNGNTLGSLFVQRRNLVRPWFYRMLWDIARFNKRAVADLDAGRLCGRTLGAYVTEGGYSAAFREMYILPMGAAIWSTPAAGMLAFPAESFIRFFKNHGLLSVSRRPQWKFVRGGSREYVRAFLRQFRGQVLVSSPVERIRREAGRAFVTPRGAAEREFDAVVLAAHADESLGMLADPTEEERSLLGAWRYQPNTAVLHSDASLLPPLRGAWASWNYTRETGDGGADAVSLTYHMNRLQRLRTREQYCVSLNSRSPVAPGREIRRIEYTHPSYTAASLATQEKLARLNGVRGTWFCGSYFGYGFHEDAVKAGAAVGRGFGLEL